LPQNILEYQKELIKHEAMSMKYYKFASLVSLDPHAKHVFSAEHHIAMRGLPGCTIFFQQYVTNGTIFRGGGGKKVFAHKM
jgi:hypothetical protein